MSTYRRRDGGYTIIEVMIVLTISVVLFAGAVTAFSQQNERTRFTESVNTFGQNLQDVLNDVETGFYPSNNDFTCVISGGEVAPQYGTANQQGKNDACVFLGKAIRFAPTASQTSQIDIYTIAGARMYMDGTTAKVVTNIDQASPKALTNIIDTKLLTSDVEIYSVQNAADGTTYSGVAVVSTGNSNEITAATSGVNTRASLAAVAGTLSMPNFTDAVDSINSASVSQASQGIYICLREKGDGRKAIVEMATDRSQIVVNVKVGEECPA